jgi:hypothetical protein
MKIQTIALGVLSIILVGCGSSKAPLPEDDTTTYVRGEHRLGTPLQGDLAFAGTHIFVGQGNFGAGTESILRRGHDGMLQTTVSGLNSIGGMVYDNESGTLYFTDNAGSFSGSTTGDTVYALPNALVAAPTNASDLEILPSGSIPFAGQLIVMDAKTLLVSEAAGSGLGGVISVDLAAGTYAYLIEGLDYAAGISILPEGNLLVGNVDAGFAGFILEYTAEGAPVEAEGSAIGSVELSGAADQVLNQRGSLLVTGGSTSDFSSSTVVSVNEDGIPSTIAEGFEFSFGIDMDIPSGQIGIVDSCYPDGCPNITLLTPTNRMTGLGMGAEDCQAAFWGGTPDHPRGNVWRCRDGELGCDRDREENGSCTFEVGACLRLTDPTDSTCTPENTDSVVVRRSPRINLDGVFLAMQLRVDEIVAGNDAACSGSTIVKVDKGKKIEIDMEVLTANETTDADRLTLRCR